LTFFFFLQALLIRINIFLIIIAQIIASSQGTVPKFATRQFRLTFSLAATLYASAAGLALCDTECKELIPCNIVRAINECAKHGDTVVFAKYTTAVIRASNFPNSTIVFTKNITLIAKASSPPATIDFRQSNGMYFKNVNVTIKHFTFSAIEAAPTYQGILFWLWLWCS